MKSLSLISNQERNAPELTIHISSTSYNEYQGIARYYEPQKTSNYATQFALNFPSVGFYLQLGQHVRDGTRKHRISHPLHSQWVVICA
jgi:hypothetical protein